MDGRPKWDFPLTERQVDLLQNDVKKISHHWKFTSEDTSENWIEFTFDDGKSFKVPSRWRELFEFTDTCHRSLIKPTFNGERAIAVLENIRTWERKNSRELSEYKRLKAKFGDSV